MGNENLPINMAQEMGQKTETGGNTTWRRRTEEEAQEEYIETLKRKGLLTPDYVVWLAGVSVWEKPHVYYTEKFLKLLLENPPRVRRGRTYYYWREHIHRINTKKFVDAMELSIYAMWQKILKYYGAKKVKLNWNGKQWELNFIVNGRKGRGYIHMWGDGKMNYIVDIEGEGIFIDLYERRIKHSKHLKNENRIYNIITTNNVAEFLVLLEFLTKKCKKGEDIDTCRARKIDKIAMHFNFRVDD